MTCLVPDALPTLAAPADDERAIQITDRPFRRFGRTVIASFQVQATPHRVFSVLTDHAHMAEFMPMVDDVRVLASYPGGARVRFHVRYLGLFDIVEVDERTFVPDRRITWHATDGPLAVSDGSWAITARGPRGAAVVYQTDVDPGVPIPSGLTAMIMQRGLREFLDGIRRRIEGDGTWRKPGYRPVGG